MNSAKTRIHSIFSGALEQQSAEAMQKYLEEACGTDQELRREVEDLLRSRREAGSFLGGTHPDDGVETSVETAELCGTRIGPFKLLEVLGEGGMGVVYLAEQTEPVERRVALKIIKPGMDSRQVIARFEAERQALAVLDHPHIAKVLDAGETESHRPYFVMELVKGIPITQFCDQRRLDTSARLKLFRQVCHAVQHAHQKGIVHRDIKPSNILVAMSDDQPIPKVIDFGVAKATSDELTEKTMFTRFGQIVGTLEYMSPEQAEFNQLDIDTRSDVYSLGAVLYELLTGEPPFDCQRLSNQPLDESLRMIREEEPSRPSVRFQSSPSAEQAAANRQTTTAKLDSAIRGELDWIVIKTLEKDRSRRYATALELAADIDRYLDNEPVNASPPSVLYRTRKFVQRNRGLLIAAGAVCLALIAGIITTTWQAKRASTALEEKTIALNDKTAALEESKRLFKRQSLLTKRQSLLSDLVFAEILHSARPGTGNPNVTVRQALKDVEQKINGLAFADRELEGWLRHNLAGFFLEIGEYSDAKRNYLRAYELRKEIFGIDGTPTLSTANHLSDLYSRLGEHDQAIEFASQYADAQAREFGNKSQEALDAKGDLARRLARAGRIDRAETILDSIIDQANSLGLKETEAWSLLELGIVYYGTARYNEAEKCWAEALEYYRHLEEDHHYASMLDLKMNLALVWEQQGKLVEAETAFIDLLPKFAAIYNPASPEMIRLEQNLATLQLRLRKFTEASTRFRRVMEAKANRFGDRSGQALSAMHNLALALQQVDSKEAKKLHAKTVQIAKDKWGPQHDETLSYLNGLGNAAHALRDYETASRCFRDIVEARENLRAEEPSNAANNRSLGGAYCNLGNLLASQRNYEEAIKTYRNAIDVLEELAGTDANPVTRRFLGYSYGASAVANRYLGNHSESLADLQHALAVADTERRKQYLELKRAQTLAAQGDYAEAIEIGAGVLKLFPEDGELAYELSALHAIAADFSSADRKESAEFNAEQTTDHVNQCIETLELAKALGHFDLTSSVLDLKTDPAFDSIRSDQRYQEFVNSIEAKKPDAE